MKNLILFVFGINIGFNSYSQNTETIGIKIDNNINMFYIDSIAFSQIDFLYTNNTDNTYILWIERDNIANLSNAEKIRKYFYTLKGDFTLSRIAYETLINEITPEIFTSFLKIIKPKEQFLISILKQGEMLPHADYLKSISDRIVIVSANESKRLPSVDDLENLNYKAKNLTILAETLVKGSNLN